MRPSIALYQPDIAQNVGTILRLGACLDMPVHVIEPCGFPFSAKALRRSAMDYMDQVTLEGHIDYAAFNDWRQGQGQGQGQSQDQGKRLVLLTTKASVPYTDFHFQPDDVLLLGQESAGVPEEIHQEADARIAIPMAVGARSLNIAVSLAMIAGEALRQLDAFPISDKWPKGNI